MPGATASVGFSIEREYQSENAHYEQATYVRVTGDEGVAGVADPMLVDPIDFEAEKQRRQEEYEPLEQVDVDASDTRFGI